MESLDLDAEVEMALAAVPEAEIAAADAEDLPPALPVQPKQRAKAKAKAKGESKKSGRGVAAGETMICPVCGISVPKQKNTCYCPDHKRTTDALFRQAKKNKEVRQKVVQLSRQPDKTTFFKLVEVTPLNQKKLNRTY